MASETVSAPPRDYKLWDLPTRFIHWALVGLIGFSWWSASSGHMEWHRWSGYGALALLSYRLVWGVVGSESARFSSFVKGPKAIVAYARTLLSRRPSEGRGHNPIGALSVLALIGAITVQVVTGLFSVDTDGLESGPLADRVSFETGRVFAQWHGWSFDALKVLIVLHLVAVGFYLVHKRTNLVKAMITGKASLSADPALRFAPLWLIVVVAMVAMGLTWLVMKGVRV
ncbi:cytochrome b/b6 domain-containing protein [Caulobacter sp.]|uniref:cytochrome b/b6 domain-containing protein n=1 Tax=Caulobacter sp. TaxID=78 RepID=UPI002B4A1C0A|nr:cytochrome b/b6 domain-containing protein [Caulobacter sp.]HJV41494.1 cytochrome b/b6 domain-containing protein [Caulobacter sp.]